MKRRTAVLPQSYTVASISTPTLSEASRLALRKRLVSRIAYLRSLFQNILDSNRDPERVCQDPIIIPLDEDSFMEICHTTINKPQHPGDRTEKMGLGMRAVQYIQSETKRFLIEAMSVADEGAVVHKSHSPFTSMTFRPSYEGTPHESYMFQGMETMQGEREYIHDDARFQELYFLEKVERWIAVLEEIVIPQVSGESS